MMCLTSIGGPFAVVWLRWPSPFEKPGVDTRAYVVLCEQPCSLLHPPACAFVLTQASAGPL